MAELDLAAEAAGPYPGLGGKLRKRSNAGHKSITRILAFGYGADYDTRRQCKRHIFQAVNGDIDPPVHQCFIELFGKETLTADFRQRHIENFVAGRFDREELYVKIRPAAFQCGPDPIRLPERQGASARSQTELTVCHRNDGFARS